MRTTKVMAFTCLGATGVYPPCAKTWFRGRLCRSDLGGSAGGCPIPCFGSFVKDLEDRDDVSSEWWTGVGRVGTRLLSGSGPTPTASPVLCR